MILEKSYKT